MDATQTTTPGDESFESLVRDFARGVREGYVSVDEAADVVAEFVHRLEEMSGASLSLDPP